MTIEKVKGGYVNETKSGKRLGKPTSHEQAVKRLREIEYFKAHPKQAGKK